MQTSILIHCEATTWWKPTPTSQKNLHENHTKIANLDLLKFSVCTKYKK